MQHLSAEATVHVRKLRPDGSGISAWTSVIVASNHSGIVLHSKFDQPRVDLGCTTLEQGNVCIEFYDWHRWYAIAQVFTPTGELKGWYGDVCTPPHWLARDVLSYIDLDLDLWCDAGGTITLLGEQEFAEHVAAEVFTAEQIAGAERGRNELRSLAEQGHLPRVGDVVLGT